MSPSRLSSVSSSEKSELLCLLKSVVSFHSSYTAPPLPPVVPASHDAAFPFKVKAAKPKLPSDNPNTDGTSSEEMLADGKAKEERWGGGKISL